MLFYLNQSKAFMFKKLFKSQGEEKSDSKKNQLNWIPLQNESQLEALLEDSKIKLQMIYKHSTSCGISSMVKRQLEQSLGALDMQASVYYLDLLSYRSVSNQVAKQFQVLHQSPQLILIKNGVVVAHDAHYDLLQLPIERYL